MMFKAIQVDRNQFEPRNDVTVASVEYGENIQYRFTVDIAFSDKGRYLSEVHQVIVDGPAAVHSIEKTSDTSLAFTAAFKAFPRVLSFSAFGLSRLVKDGFSGLDPCPVAISGLKCQVTPNPRPVPPAPELCDHVEVAESMPSGQVVEVVPGVPYEFDVIYEPLLFGVPATEVTGKLRYVDIRDVDDPDQVPELQEVSLLADGSGAHVRVGPLAKRTNHRLELRFGVGGHEHAKLVYVTTKAHPMAFEELEL